LSTTFFDLFYEALTIFDLVLPCTFLVLDYSTASEIEKQVLFIQFFDDYFTLVFMPDCIHNQ